MYVTRPLSLYRKSPESLSEPPPEGPGSGFLVIQDEEAQNFCCFGLCKDSQIYEFPFPQNKNLTVRYEEHHSNGQSTSTRVYSDDVIMVPVLGLPLSSNQYYAIRRHGRHKGEAHANSKEEDKGTCLCFRYVRDVKPTPLDPHDIYHQFMIYQRETLCGHGGFTAKSVAPDGYPPRFLKRKGWTLHAKTPKTYCLDEDARGVNHKLRAQLPNFDFSVDRKCSDAVVVGKWYCPFMFIKDGEVGDQIKNSAYYEMTLEQRWEQIYACDNYRSGRKSVAVDVYVEKENISVFGQEAMVGPHYDVAERMVWFRRRSNDTSDGEGGQSTVGLSTAIFDRMKWEQERVGLVGGGEREKKVRVKRVEEFNDEISKRFGCYLLVERFVLKRMDGTTMLMYDFYHTHQVRSKWESIEEETRI